MVGVNRRAKPLKGVVTASDIDDFALSGVAEGDLLVYNSSTSKYAVNQTLSGSYTMSNTLTVSGNLTASSDLSVGSNATVGGTLAVTGAATLSSTLNVTGTTTVSALTATSTITGQGAANISGAVSTGALTVTGNASVSGTLTAGAVSVGTLSLTSLTVSGLATLGNLSVTGVSSFNDDVSVNGNLSAQGLAGTSLSTTGDAIFSGNTRFAGTDWTLASTNTDIQQRYTDGTFIFKGVTGAPQVETTILTLGPANGAVFALDVELDGALNHDGSTVGFFGTTPATQASAYTQTYATADKTHAAETTADISVTYTTDDPSITPNGSVTIADGDAPTTSEYLEWLEELTDQQIKQRADVADLKQLVNAIIDDLQTYGLLQ